MTTPDYPDLDIAVIGQLLVDANEPKRRQYANLVVTVRHASSLIGCWHVYNYQISKKSLTRRCFINHYANYVTAQSAMADKQEAKLKNNRIKQHDWLLDFHDLKVLERWMASPGPLLKIGDAKRLTAEIKEQLAIKATPFEERIEAELRTVDDEAAIEREKAAGVGAETAKTNKNWGLF